MMIPLPPVSSPFLTLYPRLSRKTQQRLLGLSLALALLATAPAGTTPRNTVASPAGNTPITNPIVQRTLQELDLATPETYGDQFQVNSYTTSNQVAPAVALDSDGDFVVVWQSNGSDGNDTNGSSIQGQRYNSLGAAQGSQFQVNSYTTNSQTNPDVAIDSDGDFVVVWHSIGSSSGDTSLYSIQGQRYNSLGAVQGSQFQVNSYTTSGQIHPAVAMDSNGDFMVVWESNGSYESDTSSYSIQGQRYNSLGAVQGSQFQVNNYTTNIQRFPDVALDSNGDFVVVWDSYAASSGDTSGYSIQGQRYNSLGTGQGSQFQVNSYTTNHQRYPAIAMDTDGDFVVVWDSYAASSGDTSSIQGQRYNSVGTVQGSQFQVNSYTTSQQRFPAVTMDSDGDFVVVWQSSGFYGGDTSGYSIQGQAFQPNAQPLWDQFQVNSYTTSHQRYPAVALDSNGDFVVVWQSNGSAYSDTAGFSIQASQFDLGQTDHQVNTYTVGDQRRPAVAMDSDGDFVVVWQSSRSSGDNSGYSIQGQRYNSLGTVQGIQFQINNYTTGHQAFPAVTMDSDGDFVVVWESFGSSGGDTFGYSIQGRRYNSLGAALGSQFQVNGYTTNSQTHPDVAMDSDGDFVVVWQSFGSSGGDTSGGYSIQGQRYNSLGTVGSQFQVNSYTTNDQGYPAVALDSDGDFVVVWQSWGSDGSDTSRISIQSQRYNSLGAAVGSQFQINSYTIDDQRYPAVDLDSDGDFVVVWDDSYGSGYGDTSSFSIQAQRYNSLGTAVGSQFQVNSYTTNQQTSPSVALDSDGDFVVVWESVGSSGNDTHARSIQGQRYNSSGTMQGSQFQINSYTTDDQRFPAVALDSDSDFVVVWESYGSNGNNGMLEITPDTDGYSIQASRFNHLAAPVPTALTNLVARAQATLPAPLSGLLTSLAATLTAAWLWRKRVRS